MTLAELGNLGEALGAFAVLVSILYLVIQLRHHTQSIRSATYQSIVSTAATCNRSLTESPELARLLRVGREDPAKLDDDEHTRFSFLCMQFFDIFENLYLQHCSGTLDDDYFLPRSRAYVSLLDGPGFADRWAECRDNYSQRFRDYVDAKLAEPTAGAGGVHFLFAPRD